MSNELELEIGGYHYRIACQPGEEPLVHDVARRVDEEILRMRAQAGNLSEARQLLFAALTLADRVGELEGRETEMGGPDAARENRDLIDRLADRMERLAEKLEKPVDGS